MKSYPIVASNHIKGAEDFLKTLQPGVGAVLVREPTNKFDPSAVAVWIDGRKVGYVPKAQNKVLAGFIDQAGHAWSEPRPVQEFGKELIATDLEIEIFRAVDARFARSPNSKFPMVEV